MSLPSARNSVSSPALAGRMAGRTAVKLPAARERKGLLCRTFADVAQLVEHFTRNEGVPGSSPGVGSGRAQQMDAFAKSAFAPA